MPEHIAAFSGKQGYIVYTRNDFSLRGPEWPRPDIVFPHAVFANYAWRNFAGYKEGDGQTAFVGLMKNGLGQEKLVVMMYSLEITPSNNDREVWFSPCVYDPSPNCTVSGKQALRGDYLGVILPLRDHLEIISGSPNPARNVCRLRMIINGISYDIDATLNSRGFFQYSGCKSLVPEGNWTMLVPTGRGM